MEDLGVAVVIEDDVDIRNLLEGVLRQAGFEVHTAAEGREGVDVVRNKMANVVTLDIGLPDIDGFEVLRRIRSFSDAYVVMLTGRTEEPDLLSALNAGADDYIAKPFRPRELRARVAAMMRRPRHEINRTQQASPTWAAAPAAPATFGSLAGQASLVHTPLDTGFVRSSFIRPLFTRPCTIRTLGRPRAQRPGFEPPDTYCDHRRGQFGTHPQRV